MSKRRENVLDGSEDEQSNLQKSPYAQIDNFEMKRLKKVLQGVKGAKRAYYDNRLSSDKVSELKVSYVQKKFSLVALDAIRCNATRRFKSGQNRR